MTKKNDDFSYIRGTILEELINRTVDNWAKIIGYSETPKAQKSVNPTKKKIRKKK